MHVRTVTGWGLVLGLFFAGAAAGLGPAPMADARHYLVLWEPAAGPREGNRCALGPGDGARITGVVATVGGTVLGRICHAPVTLVRMTSEAALRAQTLPGVAAVAEDGPAGELYSTVAARKGVRWYDLQGIPGPDVPPVQQLPHKGWGIGVAVVDTGIHALHPDLFWAASESAINTSRVDNNWRLAHPPCGGLGPETSILSTCWWQDFVPFWVDVPATDPHGHGTQVAALVGANPALVDATYAGFCTGCRLTGLKLGDVLGNADVLGTAFLRFWPFLLVYDRLIDLIEDPRSDVPIRVVTNSWGFRWDDPDEIAYFQTFFRPLVEQVVATGAVVVFAIGNAGGDGSQDRSSPTCWVQAVVCVGGADVRPGDGDRTQAETYGASSRGKASDPATWPDLVAPAIGLDQAAITGYTQGFAGTSAAAPIVAGCVGLMLEANPALTAAQVHDLLRATAYRYPSGGSFPNHAAGYGLLDCKAAVEAA